MVPRQRCEFFVRNWHRNSEQMLGLPRGKVPAEYDAIVRITGTGFAHLAMDPFKYPTSFQPDAHHAFGSGADEFPVLEGEVLTVLTLRIEPAALAGVRVVREAAPQDFARAAQSTPDEDGETCAGWRTLVVVPDDDPEPAEAFAALTPGRQRGHLNVPAFARTAATRHARLGRLRPQVRAGSGGR
jgi:hypothetical protein